MAIPATGANPYPPTSELPLVRVLGTAGEGGKGAEEEEEGGRGRGSTGSALALLPMLDAETSSCAQPVSLDDPRQAHTRTHQANWTRASLQLKLSQSHLLISGLLLAHPYTLLTGSG